MTLTAERLKSRLIGTSLGGRLQTLQRALHRRQVARDPKLRFVAFEAENLDMALRRCVEPWHNCVDVGCHLGSMLAELCRLAPDGKHVAVEPTPRKAAWLRGKFPQVEIVEAAVSDESGEATFFDNMGNSGFSGLRKPGAFTDGVQECTVKLERLDDILADRTVDFLKVDVEGAELHAFRGARGTLKRCRPKVLFECTHNGLTAFDIDAAEVFDELHDASGYDVFIPQDFNHGGTPLNRSQFAAAVVYPFRAWNFVACPR